MALTMVRLAPAGLMLLFLVMAAPWMQAPQERKAWLATELQRELARSDDEC